MYKRARRCCAAVALAMATIMGSGLGAQAPTTPVAGLAYTAADVQFMQGMIGHHAQALVMAGMASNHGANAQVLLFCKKITISQRDEITMMQEWLKERGQVVPVVAADGHDHDHGMAGMDMDAHAGMPGMLTADQLDVLAHARGERFDRLFLTGMIQHHEGALTMVAKLFDSPGAGQTPEIFGYATGVDADQRAEIERMQGMLSTLPGRSSK
jgi:uncharacterized protein (DUF305 family)